MSLSHLLARQARLQPQRDAIYEGTRPWATYGQWAARSAGLAQRLRSAGLQPGDRVVLFMRNHPRYLELLWGAWWAGLVVVPVNAKLHPAEVEWIVDNADARWAFVTRDVAPVPLAGLQRQVDIESAEADALLRRAGRRARPPVERAPRRPGLAVLHQRHHRPAQGRDAHAAQPDDDGAGLLRRRRCHRAGRRHRLRRADVARLRPLRDPAPDGRRAPRGAGLGRRRPGRAVRARPRARAAVHLCRADHRQAPGRPCRSRRADAGRCGGAASRPSSTAARRCTWPTSSARCA